MITYTVTTGSRTVYTGHNKALAVRKYKYYKLYAHNAGITSVTKE